MSAEPPNWKRHKERSNTATVRLIVWIALHLGRGMARALLVPIVAYFFITAPRARRASRQFLRRACAPRQGTVGVFLNLYAFAACGLDRVFLLAGRQHETKVSVHDPDGMLPYLHGGGLALVLTAHLGSFEVLRVLGVERRGMRFRVVMARAHGGMLTSVLERLNPRVAADVIDSGHGGPGLALAVAQALRDGCQVGLMADRLDGLDPGLPVRFLGGNARLPSAPWKLGAVLGVPVVLCFGLYRGGNRYALHFERFLDGTPVPRGQRAAFGQACAERYAARLEHYARLAPYNWFNFYDFWADDATQNPSAGD